MLKQISIIGENIKKLRKQLGILRNKQPKLADMSYNTITKIESGYI